MAVKPCIKCKKDVSTSGGACPHCGTTNPPNPSPFVVFTMTAFGLMTCFWVFCGEDKPKAEAHPPTVDPAAQAREEAKCRGDINCWGSRHAGEALRHCRPLIERHAKYVHEWTDGALSTKLGGYVWKDQEHGVVTFFGDKIRFQNGFGAWQNMVYECDFDGDKVLDVRVRAGKL